MLSAAFLVVIPPAFADDNDGYREWRKPKPVENVAGGCPIEDRSGLTLFTAGGFDGSLDVWIYERERKRAPFGPRIKVGPPVSLDDTADFCPTPIEDDWLFFVSDRDVPGACGGADMYVANLDGGEAINLGCAPNGPNTSGRELAPSLVLTEDEVYLYYSTNGPGGDQDIVRSRLGWDGRFGPPEFVDELNTEFNDQQPNVGRGGKEVVFSSDRGGSGQDVFYASRKNPGKRWSRARNLSKSLDFPTVDGNETRASLSWDLKRLYYGSGGTIFVSKRKRGERDDD